MIVSIPPTPTHWATDTAHFLKPQTVGALDRRLHAYETKTHHQVLLYGVPTTGDDSAALERHVLAEGRGRVASLPVRHIA